MIKGMGFQLHYAQLFGASMTPTNTMKRYSIFRKLNMIILTTNPGSSHTFFFCMIKVVRNAVKKVGTDEDALTRVIVTRAEKDLKEIKEIYYKRNSVSLDQAVAKETSGDYKAFLLTLLGNED